VDGRARFRWMPAAAGAALLLSTPLAGGGQGSRAAAEAPAQAVHADPGTAAPGTRWVNGWQGSPTAGGTFDAASCPADVGLHDQTVRDVVVTSAEGDRVRVRVTNAFGAAPLRVGSASVALAGRGAAAVPGTTHPLSFGGRPGVLVAAGGEALSDPVPLHVEELQRLDVSVFLPDRTGPATQHNNARETSYLASGDHSGDSGPSAFSRPITCWMFASGVDVQASARVVGTVVALGDSITDGDQSTVDADQRYPDWLARRLAALHGRTAAVSNAGIGGNELLLNRTPALFGVSAPARLPRDVLAQAGAGSVILLEGINDIGVESAQAGDLVQVDQQIIAQVHAAGLRIYGGTLAPFGGSNARYGADYGTPSGEAQRQVLNTWIRTSGAFDGVVDFDAALRDPADPVRLRAAYDSGDHLHPSDAGYRAMAEAVDLGRLVAGTAQQPRS
jgi:lysophospholipase L1-like esterase